MNVHGIWISPHERLNGGGGSGQNIPMWHGIGWNGDWVGALAQYARALSIRVEASGSCRSVMQDWSKRPGIKHWLSMTGMPPHPGPSNGLDEQSLGEDEPDTRRRVTGKQRGAPRRPEDLTVVSGVAAANTYLGSMVGSVFRNGTRGIRYYVDDGSDVAAEQADMRNARRQVAVTLSLDQCLRSRH